MKATYLRRVTVALAAAFVAMQAQAATYSLPFSFPASQATFDECVTVDVNGDATTGSDNGVWTFWTAPAKPAFKYTYSMYNAANDWLILPGVCFDGASRVKVSFVVETYTDKESFEVMLGSSATPEAMTIPVIVEKNFTTSNKQQTLSAVIDVPTGGADSWHLGFHATSPAFMGWIYLSDISIEADGETVPSVVPGEPVIAASSVKYLDYAATVTMPAKAVDGSDLDADMTLNVYVDGAAVRTVEGCAPGTDVDVSLTLDAGSHVVGYEAVLGKQAGARVTETVDAVARVIVPSSPVVVSDGVNDLVYIATVKMPQVDSDGEAIDASMSLQVYADGVLYNTYVGCAPGVEKSVSATLAAGEHEMGFRAVLGEEASVMVTRRVVAVAPVEKSYSLPFVLADIQASFDECVTVDANGDGSESSYVKNGIWTFDADKDAFTYTYHSRHDADDWLITPLVDFGGASRVKVSFTVATGSYPERLEVMMGAGRTVAAMTQTVVAATDYKNASTPVSVVVDVDGNGPWALGFHALSAADNFTLSVSGISITDAAASADVVPGAPVVKESLVDGLDYVAVVTMPAVDADGNAIDCEMTLEAYVDDNLVEEYEGCSGGADVNVSIALEAGEHVVAFRAVVGEKAGESVSEVVTATVASVATLFEFIPTAELFGECVVVDVNDDATGSDQGQWSFNLAQQALKYSYGMTMKPGDDWLILPYANLAGYDKVRVSLNVMTYTSGTEGLEVYLGRERTVESMTLKVLSEPSLSTAGRWTTLEAEVSLPTARSAEGEWAIGLHSVSPADQYWYYVKDIRIDGLVTSGIVDVTEDDGTEHAVEYYNLQGVRVANPQNGLYIRRQGNTVTKVLVR